jgi:ubiquinone/menaquinone biosynthesis C-methylase UbiE
MTYESTEGQAWYVSFFGDDYLKAYGHSLTGERDEKEARFAIETLGLSQGDSVLDLCCGNGRHAVLLAERGLLVTGQDLSSSYLDMVRERAQSKGVQIELVHSDMRHIPYEGRFDAVISMFSSFGYLESDVEDQEVLHQIAKALKPGGRVLLDMLNREWVILNSIQNEWREDAEGTIYLEHREIDLLNSRNHITFAMVSADGTRHHSVGHHIRLYTLTEITRMLAEAGLELQEPFGSFERESYGINSRRMILVARKPS